MKKIITALIAAALFTTGAIATGFKDVAGHWGEAHLNKMIEAGVIVGDGSGHAMPDRAITYYEAGVMLSKAFGLKPDTGDEPGSGREIMREEAFAAIRGAFRFPDAPKTFASSFADFDKASDSAKAHILSLEAAGMISGKNGIIAPLDTVTRSEFAALLSKAVGVFIDEASDFDGAELERAVIRRSGLTVKSLTAEYLIVTHGATLEGCDLGTAIIAESGGLVYLMESNITELIIVSGGPEQVVADKGSIIERTVYSEERNSNPTKLEP